MVGIPAAARFKRATAMLDEVARARLCLSSGSEHSASENSLQLQDLVDVFMERSEEGEGEEEEEIGEGFWASSPASASIGKEKEMRERLLKALSLAGGEDDAVARRVREVAEIARRSFGMESDGFKRRLMTLLRQRGLDAGLCKSRWEKTSRHPAGEYQYVDVLVGKVGGARYIVEVDLAAEFEIARPTARYRAMVGAFPPVFVGQPDALREVVRLMCAAARESMRSRDMHLPPWRRSSYVIGKWFGSYKRTTREAAPVKAPDSNGNLGGKKFVGSWGLRDCRREMGLRVGNLALQFKDMNA